MPLSNFFTPRSVAVIGASADKNKVGYALMSNIIRTTAWKSTGDTLKSTYVSSHGETRVESPKSGVTLYPISVSADEVLGIKAYKSVKDIPEPVDLAVIAVKADLVPQILNECADKGIMNVTIISAGFKEMDEHGKALEVECGRIARERGLSVLGPNCLGTIDAVHNFNASFSAIEPLAGSIGFLSQSGALGTSVLDAAIDAGIGFSKFISLGNEAHLTEIEFLRFLKDDPDTKAILVYLEKLSDGPEFMKLVSEITVKKPVAILKAGRSARGLRAVMSHTGSLAPEDSVFAAACKQAGAITVESIREFFNLAKLFQLGIYKPLQRFIILTNGGGPSVVATDLVDTSRSLSLVEFSDETKDALKKVLPPMAAVGNPIDIIGDALSNRYADALNIVTKNTDADAILMLLTPQMMTEVEATAKLLVDYHKVKPIIPIFLGGPTVASGLQFFKENMMPNFSFPADAIEALDDLAFRLPKKVETISNKDLSDSHDSNSSSNQVTGFNSSEYSKSQAKSVRMMTYAKTSKLLEGAGIQMSGVFAKEKHDLIKAVSKLGGGPFVMKAISEEVVHKTEAGAVKLHLASLEEVERAWDEITKNVHKHVPHAVIEGMVLQKELVGREIIIGVKRDAIFGPTILVGLGGIFTEVMKDTSLRVAPISKSVALEMIDELKGKSILLGARGQKPVDIDALADLLAKVSKLAVENPEIQEMDFNPVMVTENKVSVVDVRVGEARV